MRAGVHGRSRERCPIRYYICHLMNGEGAVIYTADENMEAVAWVLGLCIAIRRVIGKEE